MRPFTDEEFEIMISEMTDKDHPSFDMLCSIAKKTLRSKVRYLRAKNAEKKSPHFKWSTMNL